MFFLSYLQPAEVRHGYYKSYGGILGNVKFVLTLLVKLCSVIIPEL